MLLSNINTLVSDGVKKMFVGRKISLGECEFIFKKIWNKIIGATKKKFQNSNSTKDEEDEELIKEIGLDSWFFSKPNEVHFEDIYSVIDLSGKLLNKAELSGNNNLPTKLFNKYAQEATQINQETGIHEDYDYVDVKDFPNILYHTFLSQPDKQRIDIAELIARLDH